MPEEILKRPNIISRFQNMRGKAVTQCVGRDQLVYAGQPSRLLDHSLHTHLVNMMPAFPPGFRIHGSQLRRKHPLPCPFAVGVRVLHSQSARKPDAAQAFGQIAPMQAVDPL
jgi:hypothetical protein